MNKNLFQFKHLIHTQETEVYNQNLYTINKFPLKNILTKSKLYFIVLNFSFKTIDFNKKRALPFFLALELLTNQKSIVTLSSKNVLAWKIRKGALVGCKVTLRKKNMNFFIDNLNLALPRIEKFTSLNLYKEKKAITNFLALKLSEILLFYPIELGLGINTEVKTLDINFIFNTTTKEEKIFLLTLNKIPTL